MTNETTHKSETTSVDYVYASTAWNQKSDGTIIGSKTPNTFRGTSLNSKKTNFLDGVKNPTWKSKIRAHVNATTVASGERYSHKVTPFSAVSNYLVWDPTDVFHRTNLHFYSTVGIIPYDNPYGIIGVPGSMATSVRNRALRNFMERCISARSSIEGGQNIAELQSTLNSIRHPLTSLRKALVGYGSKISKLKRSRSFRGPVGVKGLSDAVTGTYLEFKFGIIPTSNDIAQLIADAGGTRFEMVPISANASDYHSASGGTYVPPLPGGMSYSLNKSSVTKYSVTYKGGYHTGVDSEGHISTAAKLRLLPEDFLPTIWDVIPYSWMLDYVVNVGDIVKSLSFVSSRLAWGCVTTRNETTVTFAGNGLPTPTGFVRNLFSDYAIYQMSAYGGNAEFKSKSFYRDQLYESDLMPTFEIKVPTSITPYINSAAVAIQSTWKLFSKR